MSKSKISPMSNAKASRLKTATSAPEQQKPETPVVATESTTAPETPPAKSKATKSTKATKPTKPEAPAKLSCLDAAAKVLAESGEPMNTKLLIEAMAEKKLWTSPGGKTPAATLYSAILREIDVKKTESRFRKVSKGLFESTGK
ncbi:MAG: HTH domain-containing protein [Gemmataceae bacterium]